MYKELTESLTQLGEEAVKSEAMEEAAAGQ